MIDDDKRGKLIYELRKKKNLTQKELGDLINYTDKNISKWERGISFPNNPNVINKLADVFGVSVEELMYGELRVKNNELEIRENFAKQYKNNYNKYRKNIFMVLFYFLIFVIISLISTYMIFIKNSISIYSLTTDNSNFDELNSTIVITNKISIINFSKITNRDDIKLINLFFIDKNSKRIEVLKGENENYYIEEKRNYREYLFEELVRNKVYLEISYENTDIVDTIELKVERKYTNNNIFPKKIHPSAESENEHSNKKLGEKISSLGFKNIYGLYEKKINNYTVIKLDTDSMNLNLEINKDNDFERINSNCSVDSIIYEKYVYGEVVDNKELKVKDKKNCDIEKCTTINDYAMYINYIKNELK